MKNENCTLYIYKKNLEWNYSFCNDNDKVLKMLIENDFPINQSYTFECGNYNVVYEETIDLIYKLNKNIIKEFSLEKILNKALEDQKEKLIIELEE